MLQQVNFPYIHIKRLQFHKGSPIITFRHYCIHQSSYFFSCCGCYLNAVTVQIFYLYRKCITSKKPKTCLNAWALRKLYEVVIIAAKSSRLVPTTLIPSPLLATMILMICGSLTIMAPTVMPYPRQVLRSAARHGPEK